MRRLLAPVACSPCSGPSGCSSWSPRNRGRCRSRRSAPLRAWRRRPCTGWRAPSSTSATSGRSRRGATPSGRACSCSPAALDHAHRRRPAAPRSPGRRDRRNRQPGDARRRPGRLRHPGARAPLDADVHRGRPSGAAHCTAVGKALLASSSDADVRALLGRTDCRATRPHTVTDPEELLNPLAASGAAATPWTRASRRWASGVAVAVPGSTVRLAMSISGPAPRMTDELLVHAVPAAPAGGPAASGRRSRDPRRDIQIRGSYIHWYR